ncbi:MAG TPA: PsbP-related protein [Nitrosopumilaceae archaeon]|nr:PsbP-related protein [Nitrosopumilaceae archaeon]
MRFNLLAPSICFLLFVSLIPQILASSNSTEETGNYTNQLLGFSFHPPDNWTVQELKKTQPNAPDVAIVGTKVDGFAPAISVSVENSNGTLLEEYVKDQKARLQPAVDAGRLIFLSDETKKINGYDGYISESKGEFLSQNQGFIIKFKEAIISTNDKFYTITYANQEKHFDDDLQNFDDVLNSFQIVSNESNQPQSNLKYEISIGIAICVGVAVGILVKRKKSLKKES